MAATRRRSGYAPPVAIGLIVHAIRSKTGGRRVNPVQCPPLAASPHTAPRAPWPRRRGGWPGQPVGDLVDPADDLVGAAGGLVGPEGGLVALPFGLEAFFVNLLERLEALAVGPEDREVVRALARLEPDAQAGTDVPRHPHDLRQSSPASAPTFEVSGIGIVDVVLLDPVPVIEFELALQVGLGDCPARGSRRRPGAQSRLRSTACTSRVPPWAGQRQSARRARCARPDRPRPRTTTGRRPRTHSGPRGTAPSAPSLIVTIHRYCNVLSDMGFPSLSGYSISARLGRRIAVDMIAESLDGRSGRSGLIGLSHRTANVARRIGSTRRAATLGPSPSKPRVPGHI